MSRRRGTSWGCFAVSVAEKDAILEKIDGGSVIFADRSSGAKAANVDDESADSTSSQDDADATNCKVDGVAGSCISTSSCRAKGGTSTPHLCPGAADIQCCTL